MQAGRVMQAAGHKKKYLCTKWHYTEQCDVRGPAWLMPWPPKGIPQRQQLSPLRRRRQSHFWPRQRRPADALRSSFATGDAPLHQRLCTWRTGARSAACGCVDSVLRTSSSPLCLHCKPDNHRSASAVLGSLRGAAEAPTQVVASAVPPSYARFAPAGHALAQHRAFMG